MVLQIKFMMLSHLFLQGFNFPIHEFDHQATFHTDHMIMMRRIIEFEDRLVPFELMTHHESGFDEL